MDVMRNRVDLGRSDVRVRLEVPLGKEHPGALQPALRELLRDRRQNLLRLPRPTDCRSPVRGVRWQNHPYERRCPRNQLDQLERAKWANVTIGPMAVIHDGVEIGEEPSSVRTSSWVSRPPTSIATLRTWRGHASWERTRSLATIRSSIRMSRSGTTSPRVITSQFARGPLSVRTCKLGRMPIFRVTCGSATSHSHASRSRNPRCRRSLVRYRARVVATSTGTDALRPSHATTELLVEPASSG